MHKMELTFMIYMGVGDRNLCWTDRCTWKKKDYIFWFQQILLVFVILYIPFQNIYEVHLLSPPPIIHTLDLSVPRFVNSLKKYQILRQLYWNLYEKSGYGKMSNELDWLTQFIQLVSFYAPWKHQKISGFVKFPGSLEIDQ